MAYNAPNATAIVVSPNAASPVSAVQQSLAAQLGVPAELSSCISPPSVQQVKHTHHTLNVQPTTTRWVTKETTFNPAPQTVSSAVNQLPEQIVNLPCPSACPVAAPPPCAVAAPPPCAVAAPAPCVAAPVVAAVAPPASCCWTTGNIPAGGSQISGIGPGYGASYLGIGALGVGVIGPSYSARDLTLYSAF